MKLLHEGEAQELGQLVDVKLRSLGAHKPLASPEGEGELPSAAGAFVRFRFSQSLLANARGGPLYGRAFTYLSLATIVFGLASSAIATGVDNPNSTILAILAILAILGVLVGLSTAINQLWRPAQRSVARYQAAYALRREGWDFVNDRGRYAKARSEQKAGLFFDEVGHILKGVEAVDEEAATAPPASEN